MMNEQNETANNFLNTVQAIGERGGNPDFWLRHPELLVIDPFLQKFEAALCRSLGVGEEILSVFRETDATVYQIEGKPFGTFLYLKPDHRLAIFRGGTFIDSAFWERRLAGKKDRLPLAKAEYEDVKARRRTERTKQMGFPLWYKEEWALRERDLKEEIDRHDEACAGYAYRVERARLLEEGVAGLEKLLSDAGYRVKWDKWGVGSEEEEAS